MIDEPKPWIRGSPKSIVVIVAHTGAQGEFSSQGEFILAIEGPDSRPRWPAGDKGKKRIDVVIALVLLQVLLELGAPKSGYDVPGCAALLARRSTRFRD